MNDVDSGALSSQGRFARIEDTLLRIESKLDAKADTAALKSLEGRVLQHGREIDSLSRVMEGEAKAAFRMATENAARLTSLESAKLLEAQRDKDSKDRRVFYMRVVSAVAAIATIINMSVGAWVVLGAH